MNQIILERFRVGARTSILPGDRVRLSGGPTYRGARVATLRGLWLVRRIFHGRRDRVFLEVAQLDAGMIGATHVAMIAGKPYRNPDVAHWINRPYRVRVLRRQLSRV